MSGSYVKCKILYLNHLFIPSGEETFSGLNLAISHPMDFISRLFKSVTPPQVELASDTGDLDGPVSSILTWHRLYSDPQGCGPGARPFHCTSAWLTPAIFPNVEDSGAQFISVGDCVRALPWYFNSKVRT